MYIIAKQDTYLKPSIAQASTIDPSLLYKVSQGQVFDIINIFQVSQHHCVEFSSPLEGHSRWFIFTDHFNLPEISDSENKVIDTNNSVNTNNSSNDNNSIDNEVILGVPYLSQVNNVNVPHGTCNLTCVAMCLMFLGVKPKNDKNQLEDELFEFVENRGWDRHEAQTMKNVVEAYGFKDTYSSTGSITKIKNHIRDNKMPCIIHGYFTRSGHIITVVGFNDKGLIVHDPYGEWYVDGYDVNDTNKPEKGKRLLYSNKLITDTCAIEGENSIWTHFITR